MSRVAHCTIPIKVFAKSLILKIRVLNKAISKLVTHKKAIKMNRYLQVNGIATPYTLDIYLLYMDYWSCSVLN